MSVWWIGVKGDKFKAFEATEAEAFSPEFEKVYGVAFGEYRSREQAESDIKTHGAYLINEAEKELQKRAKGADNEKISLESVENSKKAVKKVLGSGQKVRYTPQTGQITPVLTEIDLFLGALQQLKLSIARVLELGIVLKRVLEEEFKKHDKDNS